MEESNKQVVVLKPSISYAVLVAVLSSIATGLVLKFINNMKENEITQKEENIF